MALRPEYLQKSRPRLFLFMLSRRPLPIPHGKSTEHAPSVMLEPGTFLFTAAEPACVARQIPGKAVCRGALAQMAYIKYEVSSQRTFRASLYSICRQSEAETPLKEALCLPISRKKERWSGIRFIRENGLRQSSQLKKQTAGIPHMRDSSGLLSLILSQRLPWQPPWAGGSLRKYPAPS